MGLGGSRKDKDVHTLVRQEFKLQNRDILTVTYIVSKEVPYNIHM